MKGGPALGQVHYTAEKENNVNESVSPGEYSLVFTGRDVPPFCLMCKGQARCSQIALTVATCRFLMMLGVWEQGCSDRGLVPVAVPYYVAAGRTAAGCEEQR